MQVSDEEISITKFRQHILDLAKLLRRDVKSLCDDSSWHETWALDPRLWDVNEAKKTLSANFNAEINVLTLSNKRTRIQIDLYFTPEYINRHTPSNGEHSTTVQYALAFRTHGSVFLRDLIAPIFQSLLVMNDKFSTENLLKMKVITKDALEVAEEKKRALTQMYLNVANVVLDELSGNCMSNDLQTFLRKGAVNSTRVFVAQRSLDVRTRIETNPGQYLGDSRDHTLSEALRSLRKGIDCSVVLGGQPYRRGFRIKWSEELPSTVTITCLD